MRLSKKEKQALQEKYKAQRQAMWSGKQPVSQGSEKKTTEEPKNPTAPVESYEPAEASSEETSQDDSSAQTELDSKDQTSIANPAQNVGDGEAASESPVKAETATSSAEATPVSENTEEEVERAFWEAGQEGGARIVTWKLVLTVIGIAIILVGVGVWLGFLFAG